MLSDLEFSFETSAFFDIRILFYFSLPHIHWLYQWKYWKRQNHSHFFTLDFFSMNLPAVSGKIRTFQGTTNYPAFLFRIQKSFVAVRKICMNQSLKRYKSNTSNRRNSKNHGIQSVSNQMWRAKKRQNFCHFYFAPESEGIFILFFPFQQRATHA